jgi:hypothetical protein
MKKLLYLTLVLVAITALGSCQKKAAATAGQAAKQYAEHIKSDNYDAFVKAIVFTEPIAPAVRKTVNATHAKRLRTVHHPSVTEKGGIREVRLVSEKPSPDNKMCDVTLTNHYNDGTVETLNYNMINDNNVWKIRETPYKEIWKATTSNGDNEIIKVRSGHERDFVKVNDNGEKEFVKDIIKRDGDIEVIKTLENGQRHREVIKTLQEGNREIDKLKVDADKEVVKDINNTNTEILKEKENIPSENQHVRAREVIRK